MEYHPLLCYDGLTGDLLKAELRDGTLHCSNDADKFMESLFQEYMKEGLKRIFAATADSHLPSFIKPVR